MYFDFNVALPASVFPSAGGSTSGPTGKKNKGKDKQVVQEQQATGDALQRLSASQRTELKERVDDLKRMGYSTIAFNHVVTSRLEPTLHRNPFAASSSTVSASAIPSAQALMPSPSRPVFPRTTLTQLQRLTLILDSASEGKNGMASGLGPGAALTCLQSYDLLAVRPTTMNTFNAVCLTHTELKPTGPCFDIISLDLSSTPRLPFHLKRSTIGKALENGAVFEVCYSDALPFPHGTAGGTSTQSHDSRLRNLISNTRDLLRVTNGGKGLILSSSATSALGLRSPTDVMNLAVVFGWSPQLARDAMTQTCRALWKRAETRRSFRGVVGMPSVVVEAGETREEAAVAATTTATAPAPPTSVDPRPRPSAPQPPQQPPSKKRPNEQPTTTKATKKQKKQHAGKAAS